MIICTTDNNYVVQNFGGVMSDNTTQNEYERMPRESLVDWIGRLAPHCNRCREQQLPFGPALMVALNHLLEAVEREGFNGRLYPSVLACDHHTIPHPRVPDCLSDGGGSLSG